MSQPSSPFPLTVTMRILKSISSLSLLQVLKCFEMKNGSGGRSQAEAGGPEEEIRTGTIYSLEEKQKRQGTSRKNTLVHSSFSLLSSSDR